MKDELSIHLIRSVLRDLTGLFADRARTEAEIDAEHRSATETNDSEYRTTRARLDEQIEAATHAARTKHKDAADQIETQYSRQQKQARRAEAAERERILEKTEHGEMAARRKWEEAVWAAETVYEAKESLPQKALRQKQKAAAAQLKTLESIEERATALMHRYRQPVTAEPGPGDEPAGTDPDDRLEECCSSAQTGLDALGRMRLLWLFQDVLPFALPLLAAATVVVIVGMAVGWQMSPTMLVGAAAALVLAGAAMLWLYRVVRSRARAVYLPLCAAVESGRRAHGRLLEEAGRQRDVELADLVATRDRDISDARQRYEPIIAEIQERRRRNLERINEKYPSLHKDHRDRHRHDRQVADEELERTSGTARQQYEQESRDVEMAYAKHKQEIADRYARRWATLCASWKDGLTAALTDAQDIRDAIESLFPAWSDEAWTGWTPPRSFAPVIRFGHLEVALDKLPGGLPTDQRLHPVRTDRLSIPAVLSFPDHCSLLLDNGADGRAQSVRTLQTLMMRLLTSLPPGKVRFTIIDPIGLGQNFAGFMHLADYNEALVGGKIWTETRHIEQRLADLTEHMENVIQKYLRNEYETIARYNEQAGEIAEPYRFVVVCDFPTNFSDGAARRLNSILSSGARCGVYTLISRDTRQPLPRGVDAADLRKHAIYLACEDGRFAWADDDFGSYQLTLDPPPHDALVTETLKRIGCSAQDAGRVEVPFDVVAPTVDRRWSADATTEVRVPLGRAGATRLQELVLGHGTNQHALISGKTGSGKSTLLHVLVTNVALLYGPDQVELYLVDFKKGVEFKTYATHDLPHARAVAIESDREFGLSVLQRLDEELKHRGSIFRDLGVQDLAAYVGKRTGRPMPRTLLVIDEFQEFFVEDDKLAQDAALLLDRLVRQGRAFGIHVLLGSQTLAGAYTLARSTLGQMGVRIALQCSEIDSYLILNDDNAAARLLSRPGEAIYNDANGQVEGNSPFQVVWLPESVRDRHLEEIRRLARIRGYRRAEPQIVFEGNAPADLAGNHLLAGLLDSGRPAGAAAPRAWLGEAVAIKGPTEVEFARHGGSNLVIAGQRDEAALATMAAALVSLAAERPPGEAAFWILDGTPSDSPHAGYLRRLAEALPHEVHCVAWREVEAAVAEIAAALQRRRDDGRTDAPCLFVLVHGLQRFRQLRHSDDFSFSMDAQEKPPSADRQFGEIVREGPAFGVHVLAWCDTVTSLERTLDRQGLREFDNRMLFQMSGPDSTTLIDSPAASRLGIHRALLGRQEGGTLEKFRPYGLPDDRWLAETIGKISGQWSVVSGQGRKT